MYDATFWGNGVRDTLMVEFVARYPTLEYRPLDIDPEQLGPSRAWLRAQVGKPYDWTALLSWIVRRDWQEPDAWFCSELSEAFIGAWARPRFREAVSRVTPRHQDMLI